MPELDGKHILIAGAYSAIGQATARRLAAAGARIIGLGRDPERLEEAIASLPGEGHRTLAADAAAWDQLQPLAAIGREVGGFDGALVAAGKHEVRPLALLDADQLQQAFHDNVTTALMTTRAVARASSREGASIVWISSVAAMRGSPAFAAYAAAKGALVSAARVVAAELAGRKTRINVVAAGVVRTPMSQGWLARLSQEQQDAIEKDHLLGIGQPEDVADVIVFLLSPAARWMTGSVVTVDGGLSAH